MTVQNEPDSAELYGFDSCRFSPEELRDFVKLNLGPELRRTHPEVQIVAHDDQRGNIVDWTRILLSDPEAAQYVSGLGFHWYCDAHCMYVCGRWCLFVLVPDIRSIAKLCLCGLRKIYFPSPLYPHPFM